MARTADVLELKTSIEQGFIQSKQLCFNPQREAFDLKRLKPLLHLKYCFVIINKVFQWLTVGSFPENVLFCHPN